MRWPVLLKSDSDLDLILFLIQSEQNMNSLLHIIHQLLRLFKSPKTAPKLNEISLSMMVAKRFLDTGLKRKKLTRSFGKKKIKHQESLRLKDGVIVSLKFWNINSE